MSTNVERFGRERDRRTDTRRPSLTGSIMGALLTVACATPAIAQVPVTSCGIDLGDADGVLVGDLDCTGAPAHTISLCKGTLDFGGFTMTGARIVCDRCRCTIQGPGTLVDGQIDGSNTNTVTVRNMTLDNTNDSPTTLFGSPLYVWRGNVFDSLLIGAVAPYDVIRALAKLKVVGSEIREGDARGIRGETRLIVRDSIVTANAGIGIDAAARTTILDSEVSNNAFDGIIQFVQGTGKRGKLKLKGTTISGNGWHGVHHATVATVLDSDISNNGLSGLKVSLANFGSHCTNVASKIVRSTLTGNGTSPDCGTTELCVDVDYCPKPRVKDVTCDLSHDRQSGTPGVSWGFCAFD